MAPGKAHFEPAACFDLCGTQHKDDRPLAGDAWPRPIAGAVAVGVDAPAGAGAGMAKTIGARTYRTGAFADAN